ncbi:MAG TPA: response regulator [Desulfuromonadales bacterium]|nr:response regulator [Desulfuromonadales bacterium]
MVTILLVDDEENILKALQRLLMDEDFDIETATSGEAALEKLQTLENVALIVSDQRMPGMNGAEFLGRSQELVPHAQRILLTGYSDINATIEAINKGGARRYISKPWDDEELVQAIRDAVDFYLKGSENRHLNEIISTQKQELEEWNSNLKKRLLQSAATIREQTQVLQTFDDKGPLLLVYKAFDGFFDGIGERSVVHARTVSTLVTDVVRKMGLDAGKLATLRLAALLHDVGKFGTLANGMHKHLEEMTESEAQEYRQHPLRGEKMFSHLDELASILPLIRSHHEAYDGSGFPDRLRGEQIPLGARLIAIADFIEKSARSVDDNRAGYAMMNVTYYAGTLLDPLLVPAFRDIVNLVYADGKKTGSIAEVEVNYMDVVSGMLTSRDVIGANGVLLIKRGIVLDAAGVALIQSQYKKNPPQHGIFIQIVEA